MQSRPAAAAAPTLTLRRTTRHLQSSVGEGSAVSAARLAGIWRKPEVAGAQGAGAAWCHTAGCTHQHRQAASHKSTGQFYCHCNTVSQSGLLSCACSTVWQSGLHSLLPVVLVLDAVVLAAVGHHAAHAVVPLQALAPVQLAPPACRGGAAVSNTNLTNFDLKSTVERA